MPKQELTVSPKQRICALIGENKLKIADMLPRHIEAERFVKSALLAIGRNKDLWNCTPQSVLTTIINAAELGLDFTPAKGHAYLVPYKNVATFMPGYRGMIDLAKRSGTVSRIEAHVVHKNDEFRLEYGLNPVLEHKPVIEGDPGAVVGAYAIAWFKDGETQHEFMTRKQLDAIRKRAKTDYIWKSDEEEMQRKTVVRRLFKYLPCSPDLEKAMEYDNEITGIEETGESGERTNSLADLVNGMDATDAEYEDIDETKDKQPDTVKHAQEELKKMQEQDGLFTTGEDNQFKQSMCGR